MCTMNVGGRVRRLRRAARHTRTMRIAIAADERTGVADAVSTALAERGHEVVAAHGALSDAERDDWAWCAHAAARDVAAGRADQAIVCCWTGTGASIAANKVPGIRAALCGDAATAEGARTLERRQRPGAFAAHDLGRRAGGDPRRVVRRGPERGRRRRGQPRAPRRDRGRALSGAPVLIDARAAARPELGGVERWARELSVRLPALDPERYAVARPPARAGASRRACVGAAGAAGLAGGPRRAGDPVPGQPRAAGQPPERRCRP